MPLLASLNVSLPPEILDLLEPLRAAPERSAGFCDLDGTLAPIVARPELVRLAPGALEQLTVLRGRMGMVGFVSGRALANLEELVGLPGCVYAGNHGMELRTADGRAGFAPGVADQLVAIEAFARAWPSERLEQAGVRLEEKGATISFHTRGAPDAQAAADLLERIGARAEAEGLVARPGRQVLEIRPGLAVDKGTAVRALLDGQGLRRAVYFGDDTTDADAWAALRALVDEGQLDLALALAVSSSEVPANILAQADGHLADPTQVVDALRHLAMQELPPPT